MILIIDDDSAVRSSLSFMLKRAGYEAQTVSGPREAMEVVRSVAPSGDSGDTDDCMGKHTAGSARYAGRSLRFYHQTLE